MAPLERPLLADQPPGRLRPTTEPRKLPSDFRRRLTYYLSGVAIGVILVIPILSAKCQARRNAQSQPGSGSGIPTP